MAATPEQNRNYRKRHRALGLCVCCDQPKGKGIYCEKHRLQFNEYQRKRWRILVAQGLCLTGCGRSHVNGKRCAECLEKVHIRQRRYLLKKRGSK